MVLNDWSASESENPDQTWGLKAQWGKFFLAGVKVNSPSRSKFISISLRSRRPLESPDEAF